MREIRTSERITEKMEEKKGYLKIKPSKGFEMSTDEITAFWMNKINNAREEIG